MTMSLRRIRALRFRRFLRGGSFMRRLLLVCCLCVAVVPGLACSGADKSTAEKGPAAQETPASDVSSGTSTPALSGADKNTTDEPTTIVMDDFESGSITDWQVIASGAGGWFVYSDGKEAPDPAQSDPNVPFDLPDPPQGKFAAVTDMNGPGTRILYRDVKLDGRFTLHLTVFYAGAGGFSSPQGLGHDA